MIEFLLTRGFADYVRVVLKTQISSGIQASKSRNSKGMAIIVPVRLV